MNSDSYTILLVEDEAIIALEEAETLEEAGFRVIVADGGQAALDAILEGQPRIDLVLMDIDLGRGKMDGPEAAQLILAARDVPIVFLSSHIERRSVERVERISSYGYIFKESGPIVLVASVRMAFRLREALDESARSRDALLEREGMLERNERRYRSLFENMLDGCAFCRIVHDEAGKARDVVCVEANPIADKQAGIDGLAGRIISEAAPGLWEIRPDILAACARVASTGMPEHLEICLEQNQKWFSMALYSTERGTFTAIFENITRRKLDEMALREKTEEYRRLVENMNDLVCELDAQGIFLYASPAFEKVLGYPAETLVGKSVAELLHPDELEPATETFARLLVAGAHSRDLWRLKRADGAWRSLECSSTFYERSPGELRSIVFSVDVSEKLAVESDLARSLAEKEILFKELQHRVKNNLELVSSLLSIESRNLTDESSRRVFLDAQARIRSMSGIYERLYLSSNIDRLDLRRYLESFLDSLYGMYVLDAAAIRFATSFEELSIDLKRAVSLGLIVNELVTNALKYAYPLKEGGEIRVSLARRDGRIELSVADDGAGLPSGFDPGTTGSMGFTILRMLAAQLEGTIETSAPGRPGASVVVAFPA